MRTPPVERFWPKVEKTDSCWLWTAARQRNGYGLFAVTPYVRLSTHRFSWELHFGEIPAGLMVLHRCDVRNCVNPAHLFLGTAADNTRDMIAKGRQRNRFGQPVRRRAA